MAIHQCPNCSYKSTRSTDVRRHMELKNKAQQLGGDRFSDPKHKPNVERPQVIHSSQHMNLQASDQHSFNPQRSAQDLYSPYDIRLKENFPLTSTRKVTELFVESLTLRYEPMGNSPR